MTHKRQNRKEKKAIEQTSQNGTEASSENNIFTDDAIATPESSSVDQPKTSRGRALVIVIIVILILGGLSFIPFSKITNGRISDINLLSDVITLVSDSTNEDTASIDMLDPELAAAMKDTRIKDTVEVVDGDAPFVAAMQPRQGGMVVIEDYTVAGHGLQNLREALKKPGVARIAVIGDSYIEGDIFTEYLREMLQTKFGGKGVGYMNMHSDFPGFRKSVKQGGNGWREFSANKDCKADYTSINQHYFTPKGGNATSTYSGTSSLANLDTWGKSLFLFVAPVDMLIKTRTGENEWQTHQIAGSSNVQSILVDGVTSKFEISASSPSLIALGTWLFDDNGVSVDCMSSRGFSGLTLNKVSSELTSQINAIIPYDLIILEFGINAMSPKQTNFDVYSRKMIDVINHIKDLYPNTDILLMGIGDRGEKRGGEVHSMEGVPYMISAQREAARKGRCLFYDTREAMGGNDAVVEWVRQGYVNKDYIHMSHAGGKKLAEPIFNAIVKDLAL